MKVLLALLVVLLLAVGASANPCAGVNTCKECALKNSKHDSKTKGSSPEIRGGIAPTQLAADQVCAWHFDANPAECKMVAKGTALAKPAAWTFAVDKCPAGGKLVQTKGKAKDEAKARKGKVLEILGDMQHWTPAPQTHAPTAPVFTKGMTKGALQNQPEGSGIKGDGIHAGQSVFWSHAEKVWRYWRTARDPLTGADLSNQKMKTEKNDFIPGGEAPVLDACRVSPTFCQGAGQSFCGIHGGLCGDGTGAIAGVHGMPRARMPQIKDEGLFLAGLSSHLGKTPAMTMAEGTMAMDAATPTQNEISVRKSQDIGDLVVLGKKTPDPTVMSSDGYIVDGHHRWSAYKWAKMAGWTGNDMPVKTIPATIGEIIGWTVSLLIPNTGADSAGNPYVVDPAKDHGFFVAGLLEVYGHLSLTDARAAYVNDVTARLASNGLSLEEHHLHAVWNHKYSHLFSDELKSNN